MSFSAEVLRVLIASPSDVHKERDEIENAIFQWNSLYAEETGIILLPSRWENDVTPTYHGADPQQVINEQLVSKCDILIGIFWTKLGTPTLNNSSGTLEEINIFIEQGKEVMVYFSDNPIPRNFDYREVEKVDEYKREYGGKGVYSPYDVNRLSNHLYRKVQDYKRKRASENAVDTPLVTVVQQETPEETSIFPFEKLFLEKDFTKRELLLLYYVIETGNRHFGSRWKADDTLKKIQEWESTKFLKTDIVDNYEETLFDLVERGLLEPTEFTSYDNPRLYSMPLSYFRQLRQLPKEVIGEIDTVITSNYFIF